MLIAEFSIDRLDVEARNEATKTGQWRLSSCGCPGLYHGRGATRGEDGTGMPLQRSKLHMHMASWRLLWEQYKLL
jgi:hypothetical protein